ncbi:hypothetical protein [Hyphomicrobium sp. MC8b]|uniref:hypothetical protein n=1 Tax=Hyphomicrobium sp. MC8b TaxID=300273 RepID=UPI00391BD7B6
MSETPRAIVPLRIQADEAHRELAMRHRVYPGQVKRGKMTEAEAQVGYDVMRAIRDTLRLFAEYETEIRSALRNAIEARRTLESDPVAQSIAKELDARAVEVREREEQFEFMEPGSEGSGGLVGVPPSDRLAGEGPAP